ncbi:hypothetical protein [Blastococcus tunisiensis]|uniref:Uncharacterized protein n=1 Tax=Blastococcus tunisiensis TaxID=1798228 RepID=A0A1I2KIN4_9ACTN|nr:hypothetical protein [Blastococcus sp. DSM 46838]SFF66824.1 hypothetical protein SAMN05216574_1227 [Blastococcus sp. DSM 46838]
MINAQRITPGEQTVDAMNGLIARDPELAALWGMTLQVLAGRAGWALYHGEDDDYAWLFGWEGQGLLVVSVEPYGLDCFHWRADTNTTVNSARELWEWAKELEDPEEAAGVSDLIEMRTSLRRAQDTGLGAKLPRSQ